MDKLINEMQKLYVTFNKDLFDNVLPSKIAITVEETKPGVLGLFQPHVFEHNAQKLHRIVISYARLNGKNDALALVKTLLHEMVHCYNFETDVKDVQRGGKHNENFKNQCEKIGLSCDNYDAKLGYSDTEYTDQLKDYVTKLIDIDAFEITCIPKVKKMRIIKPRPKFVYTCSTCGEEFTSKKPLHVVCSDCGMDFDINLDKSKNLDYYTED